MSQQTNTKTLPPKPAHFTEAIRRIVTSHDENGKVVIQSDEKIPLKTGGVWGVESASIWATTETPSKDNNLPASSDGTTRIADRFGGLVSTNGTYCFMGDVAPGADFPMHRTHTIDYIIIMSGTLVNIMDGGQPIIMKGGDVLVQKGVKHAWRNPGPEWVRWICILIDADPANVDGKNLEEKLY